MPDERARIVLLVGPKGSGKTTLGRMLEQGLGGSGAKPRVEFLEVERIAQRVLAEHGGTIDADYERRVFDAFLDAIAAIERQRRVIILETTGASDETPRYLERLRARYAVTLVRVRADADTCAARIVARDPTRQVSVPIELIREMHRRTEALAWDWDLELDNGPGLSADEVCAAVAPLLQEGGA